MTSKLGCILLFLIGLLISCGAESPEPPLTNRNVEPQHAQESITYLFGDANLPEWKMRIKPGMSQTELLEVWGKPWSAYRYPRTIASPERDAWCYYTLGKDFAIVLWNYDAKQWNAPAELSAAVWGKGSGTKLGMLGDVTIYGAINNNKYLADEAEIKRLFNLLYISYWKVKII